MPLPTSVLLQKEADITTVNGTVTKVKVSLYSVDLKLRVDFNTSHSSSSTRTNAVVRLSIAAGSSSPYTCDIELGLPPKKAGVYHSDLDDVVSFFNSYFTQLDKYISDNCKAVMESAESYDPFESLPPPYFPALRIKNASNFSLHSSDGLSSVQENEEHRALELTLKVLLSVLDKMEIPKEHISPSGGLEMAILGVWAGQYNAAMYELFLESQPCFRQSSYTVSITEDEEVLQQTVEFAFQHTTSVKIKVNDNIEQGAKSLAKIIEIGDKIHPNSEKKYIVDANAAWTPQIAQDFFAQLSEPAKKQLAILEQPFPTDVLERADELVKWVDVKELYNQAGIQIFADESMSSADDVAQLLPLINGVNIKLEKAGGYRGALKAMSRAKENNLQIWVGTMLGSILNSSAAAHLLCLNKVGGDIVGGDVDGGLLVDEKLQEELTSGGFKYGEGKNIGIVQWQLGFTEGIGCSTKIE